MRADDVPLTAQRVGSGSGGEFRVNVPFGTLCRVRNQTETNYSSHSRTECGYAEGGITTSIESAALAARPHAPGFYPNVGVPDLTWLWTEKFILGDLFAQL